MKLDCARYAIKAAAISTEHTMTLDDITGMSERVSWRINGGLAVSGRVPNSFTPKWLSQGCVQPVVLADFLANFRCPARQSRQDHPRIQGKDLCPPSWLS